MCTECECEICWCEEQNPHTNRHEEWPTPEESAIKQYERDWQWAIEENQYLLGIRL